MTGLLRMGLVGLAALAALPTVALGAEADKHRVALIELDGEVLARPSPFAWLMGPEAPPTLRDLVTTIESTADSDVQTVLLRLKDVELNRAQIEEIGAAMRQVRDAGKQVRLFAEAYGPAELALAAYADEAIVQSGGVVSLPGLYMEEMFLADTLAWLGLKADLVQVGDYKGANEMLVNNAPSPAWDQNINQLLDSLYENMRETLKEGRGLSDAQLDKAMEVAWLADADDAVRVGLVDAAVDLPDLGAHLAGGDDAAVAWVEKKPVSDASAKMDFSNPFALLSVLSKKPTHEPTGPTIAVLHIDGPIVDGDSQPAGLFGDSGSVGSRTIRRALEEILEHDQIKGVVVRVDSPGGSAVASEITWQGIRRVAAAKPVWVSVGAMAASGGYYVAVAGDKIYVNPSSIVGSIGVVGGKISMGGLYEKLRVNVTGRARGPRASLFNSTEPWGPEQIELVRAKMLETYELFTERVRAGRPGIDLSKTAEGRLFTGDKAIGLGMADQIGGLDRAIEDLAAELALSEYDVMDYPGPKGFDELFEEMFSGFASAPGVARGRTLPDLAGAVRELIGEERWRAVSDALTALMQLRREPVLLTMPRAIIVR